ncbi:MAG TPA: ABC transporter substrate-binding protein [Caldisericia bacterium]|nr:ABC transporter substrate-binding protein [Caldisericia bacterium]HXK51512.1 ABC transporter substrate-binding protein [Caldisericia bacterium]
MGTKLMKYSVFAVAFCVFCMILFAGCSQKNILHVGFAEDQSSQVSTMYTSLSNGRKLQSNKLKMNSAFQFYYFDTRRDPEVAGNAFREFFQKHTHGIMMGTPSAECAQIAKYVADTWERTFICNSYQASIVDQVQTTLLLNQNPYYQGKLSARYAISEMQKKRICIIVDQSNDRLVSLKEGLVDEGRIMDATVMEIGYQNPSEIDPNAFFAKISQSNVDAVFLLISDTLYQPFLMSARKDFQIHVPFILSTLPSSDFQLQSDWENTYFFLSFFDKKPTFISSSFYQDYVNTFAQPPDLYAALGADEMILLDYAVSTFGSGSIVQLYKELRNSDLTEVGFLTDLRGFDSKGLALKPIDIVHVKNQKLTYQQTYWHEFTKQEL